MLGSFIFSFAISIIFFRHLETSINILLMSFVISFFSQIGDLIISYFKRKAKIKDTGTFLPGHGGLLDRMDGYLLAVPTGIVDLSTTIDSLSTYFPISRATL